MSVPFEQEHFDTLRAIEQTVFDYYTAHPDLVDLEVDKALEGLIRVYQAEERVKRAPKLRLSGHSGILFEQLNQIGLLYLGRDEAVPMDEPISLNVLIACYKRIRRSVDQMSKRGRQGYVQFLEQFFTG